MKRRVKMKNKSLKILWILLLPLILSSCSFVEKTYTNVPYGIIKGKKMDRMGIPRDDVYEMERYVMYKYGISFSSSFGIQAPFNYIKFYDDIIVTIKGQKYIIPKEDIEEYGIDDSKIISSLDEGAEYSYKNGMPVEKSELDYNNYILEIGEIEIIDKEGNIVKERRKIPPILFKTTYYIAPYKAFAGAPYKVLYHGWAEDYSKD